MEYIITEKGQGDLAEKVNLDLKSAIIYADMSKLWDNTTMVITDINGVIVAKRKPGEHWVSYT